VRSSTITVAARRAFRVVERRRCAPAAL